MPCSSVARLSLCGWPVQCPSSCRASDVRIWNANTSRPTIPSTNVCHACGSHLVNLTDLYTAKELKNSPTYNEMLPRGRHQNSLIVRLDGADGSHITWGLNAPASSDSWGFSEIGMAMALLRHICQFARVRQGLQRAETRETSVTALLENPRIGVLHLDRRGQIMAANDRARRFLCEERCCRTRVGCSVPASGLTSSVSSG